MEPGLLKSADWPILIDVYFFLGGVAGGAFVIATIASLLDGRRYQDVVRVGYYVALLALIPCPILLIADLGLPTRFLNMLMVTKPSLDIGLNAATAGPFHIKPYSPMSVGAWGLMAFSVCAFLCAGESWLADRHPPSPGGSGGTGRGVPLVRTIAGPVGSVFGFFLAAYPGVLLGATARPLFISAHWLGALFLAVGAATGSAAIALVLGWRSPSAQDALARVMRVTSVALVVELVALTLLVVSVKAAGSDGVDAALAQLLRGPYSLPFWLGAVFFGAVLPLLLQRGVIGHHARGMTALRATLVLVGGFLVKFVLIAAGQASLNGGVG
jgi:formate-dependent nitrite reductase membrane component NrfD